MSYDPTQDQDLVKMIGDRLVKIAVSDPEFDPEPYVAEEPVWDLRFGEMVELVAGYPEKAVGVRFSIMDSVHWDGTGDPEYDDPANRGFNIGWSACTAGGADLGVCVPYNYTDRVWTRDRDELWERAEGTLDTLEEWVATKGWED